MKAREAQDQAALLSSARNEAREARAWAQARTEALEQRVVELEAHVQFALLTIADLQQALTAKKLRK